MTDYISDPPTLIEQYLDYVITKLNKFIEDVYEGTIIIDTIVNPTLEKYNTQVTIRFEETDEYHSKNPELKNISRLEADSEEMCISIENDEYLHILSTTRDWSYFDKNRMFEVCLDLILED